MAKREKTLNAVIGDVLRGEFTKYGLTLEVLADRTQIPYGTLRKKIVGTSPIFATELLTITAAIDERVTPAGVLNEAQQIWERHAAAMATVVEKWSEMSEAEGTNEIQRKRHEKEEAARVMTPEELDQVTQRAATTDAELEQDEPPTT